MELVLVFFSIDFTQIKQKIPYESWTEIINSFYEFFKNFCDRFKDDYALSTNINLNATLSPDNTGLRIWKLIGDEVVLICAPTNIFDIPSVISTIFNEVKNFEHQVSLIPTPDDLNIRTKSTAWIVQASPFQDSDKNSANKINNTYFTFENQDISTYDFVGEHVDRGFRLSQFTLPHVLSISIELYYLILNLKNDHAEFRENNPNYKKSNDTITDLIENIKLVGHQELKGVDSGNLYPIIWYSDTWDKIEALIYTSKYKENEFIKNLQNLSKLKVKETEKKKEAPNLEDFTEVRKTAFYTQAKKFYEQIHS